MQFLNIAAVYPALFGCSSFDVGPAVQQPDGIVRIEAAVTNGSSFSRFIFFLVKAPFGKYKGSWMTKQLLPFGSKYLPPS